MKHRTSTADTPTCGDELHRKIVFEQVLRHAGVSNQAGRRMDQAAVDLAARCEMSRVETRDQRPI